MLCYSGKLSLSKKSSKDVLFVSFKSIEIIFFLLYQKINIASTQ